MVDGKCGFKAIHGQPACSHVDACIVDKDMDGGEVMKDMTGGALHIVEVGKISMHKINFGIGKSREFRFERLCFFLVPVHQNEMRSCLCDPFCGFMPHARGCAGDHTDLTIQPGGCGFLRLSGIFNKLKFFREFHFYNCLSKIFVHEFSVRTMEPGDLIENISPEIVIISLSDDTMVLAKGEFGAAEHGRAGKLFEDHGHLPFHEDLILILRNGRNIHVQLFAALGEAVAQGNEIFLAFHPLNAVLKNDIIMVVRENMRPIGLSLAVIGLRPKPQNIVGT